MRGTGSSEELAARDGTIGGQDFSCHVRLRVHDGSSWVNLSNLYGHDFLRTWRVSENVDDPAASATFELAREIGRYSLAPHVQGSRLNRAGGTPGGAYAPMISEGRRVELQYAFGSFTGAPGHDWRTLFRGRIVSVDSAGESVTLTCQDDTGDLLRRKLKRTRWYALAQADSATSGCAVWLPGMRVVAGERVIPRTPDGNPLRSYLCTVGGVTGATEPTWSQSLGATFSDGTVTWETEKETSLTDLTPVETVMQAILNDAFAGTGVSPPTLQVPVASEWAIRAYEQDRVSAIEALNRLAAQRGWVVRQVYNAATDGFDLTFYEPDRSKVDPDATWTNDPLRGPPTEMSSGLEGVRNWIRVIGYDRNNPAPDGQPRRVEVELNPDNDVRAAASAAKYGEQFAEVSLAATEQLDTLQELENLADAILSDLHEPLVSYSAPVPFFPWAELGDLYRFPADRVRHDNPLDVAVVAIEHLGREGVAQTVLSCRGGAPVAKFAQWHAVFPNRATKAVRITGELHGSVQAVSMSAVPSPGGAELSIAVGQHMPEEVPEFELHVSSSPGFTPSSATFYSRVASTAGNAKIDGLTPGQTYYLRAVPVSQSRRGVAIGQPFPEVSFTAGYVTPDMLDPTLRAFGHATREAAFGFGGGDELLIEFDSVGVNVGGGFEGAEDTFVAPSDGFYEVGATLSVECDASLDADVTFSIRVNGTPRVTARQFFPAGGGVLTVHLSGIVQVNQGDEIQVWAKETLSNLSGLTVQGGSSFFVRKIW